MIVERKSPLTNEVNKLDLNITEEQIQRWKNGELIQRAFPHLSADEREFLISGCMPGEYEEIFRDEDEDDDYDEPPF